MARSVLRGMGVTLGVWLLSTAGCGGGSDSKRGLSEGCVSNSDCAGSLVCSFGHCHQPCNATKDCPTGARCVKATDGSNACQLPQEAKCKYNSDCNVPLVCASDGECRNQCQQDRDCITGQVCTTTQVCAEPTEVDAQKNLVGAGGSSGAGGQGGQAGAADSGGFAQNGGVAGGGASGGKATAGVAGYQATGGAALAGQGGNTAGGGLPGGSSSGGAFAGGGTTTAGNAAIGGNPTGGSSVPGGTSAGGSPDTGGTAGQGGKAQAGTAGSGGVGGVSGGSPSTGGLAGGAPGSGGATGAGGGVMGGNPSVGGGGPGGGTTGPGGTATAGGGYGGTAANGGTGGSGGAPQPGAVWYVDSASAGGDGKSWSTAFATLQAALTNSLLRPGHQIWIAKGTHTPAASGGNRTTYFYLMNGVALYGGFHGTEVTLADRDNPVDPSLTVLSGDLAANDGFDTSGNPTNRTDNTYHVVVGASNAVLDGLTISGGNANGSATEQQQGGGMYNLTCDGLRLSNVRFVSNIASGSGAGLYNAAGSYTTEQLVNVVFVKNRAGSEGGGLYNSSGNATLRDVTFASNSAAVGGGMTNASGAPLITRVMFVANSASSGSAGGLHVAGGNPNLTNVTFGGNVVTNGNNPTYGGGIDVTGGAPVLANVTFVGNIANDVNANGTPACGGGIALRGGNSVLIDVTLSGNWTNVLGGGGICHTAGSPKVTNGVIWGNYTGASINETRGTGFTFSRSNMHTCGGSTAWSTTCGTDGGGNVDTSSSPFATYRAPSGSWTAVPAYSANRLQTTFTNTLAPWVAGELVGMFIRPDASQPQRLPIVANTATTLTVWGDAASTAASGTMYYIYDVRLATGSACIDTGDNSALPTDVGDVNGNGDTTEVLPWDLDNRPRVVNATVDMGAYEYQGG
jgi:hypothetical protein